MNTLQQLQPMRTAPKDGTVIYVLLDGANYTHPLRYSRNARGFGPLCWRHAWDMCAIAKDDLQGWHGVPEYQTP